MNKILLSPLRMGDIQLKNRIGMSALSRRRALPPDWIPFDLHTQYYTQRSSAGFMLTGCVLISDRTMVFPGNCGLYTYEQALGWKTVIDQVHAKNGILIAQLWHGGRACHSTLQNNQSTLGPSAISIRGFNKAAQKEQEIPNEMTKEDINMVLLQFKKSAELAKIAGFDGLELHGAHGYLIDQFLKESSNKRTDEYGGSIQNRCKFCLEVMDQLISVFGSNRVGIKLSPVGSMNDMYDSNTVNLYKHLITELNNRKIAFIEMKDDNDQQNAFGFGYPSSKQQISDLFDMFRPLFKGVMIANNEYTPEKASEGIQNGKFDAVSFGRLYISNPDLVERVKHGYKLNYNWDKNTFYFGGPKGYIDYPIYEEQFQK